MRALAAVVGLLSLGCIQSRVTPLPIPPEVRWVAVIEGERVSPLFDIAAGRSLPTFTAAGEPVQLVGFTEAQVRGAPDSASLSLAGPCEKGLPTATWFARLDADDTLHTLDADDAPGLTAPWVGCAPASLVVHAGCAEVPCAASGTVNPDCKVSIDLSACFLESFAGVQLPDGAVCFANAPPACAPTERIATEVAALQCSAPRQCRLSVYPPASEPPFEIARVDLLPGETFAPSVLNGRAVLNTRMHSGSVFDLAVLSDVVVVAHTGGPSPFACPQSGLTYTQLELLDPDALATIGTTTAPPCLTRLIADGDELIGVHGDAGSLRLSRFDSRGRALVIGPPGPASVLASTHIPAGPLLVGDPPRLQVLYEWTDAYAAGSEPGYLLYAYDPVTLAVVHSDRVTHGRAYAFTGSGASQVAIADEESHEVVLFDVDARAEAGRVEIPIFAGVTRRDITMLSQHDLRFVAATPHDQPSVRIAGAAPEASVVLTERRAAPHATIAWPPDPKLALVAGLADTSDGRFESVVSLVDTTTGRVLPGAWVVGSGAVTRMHADRAGRVWLVLGWSGDIVRLTPR